MHRKALLSTLCAASFGSVMAATPAVPAATPATAPATKPALTPARTPAAATAAPALDVATAGRFANLALKCLHNEYPNHISHTMDGDRDARAPRDLTPAFYGCLDWHSDVHGHWLLVRLLRLFPDAPFAAAARAEIARSLTAGNIAGELSYLKQPDRASFERPYGLAWLLQLASELRSWPDPQGQQWLATLRAARNRGRGAPVQLAAQAPLPDSRRRTRPDRVFLRPDLGLGRRRQ